VDCLTEFSADALPDDNAALLIEFLLLSRPRNAHLGGQKKQAFNKLWTMVALMASGRILKVDQGRLPANAQNAARALLHASMDLCRMMGIAGPDLAAEFNARSEAGDFAKPVNPEEAIDHANACLALLLARRLEAGRG